MFSIPHLVIIFVVVLVVFGPEKLPELARNLGKIMGDFRRATGDLQNTFQDHLRDIEREASKRQTPPVPGTTVAPAKQNTIAPPKTDSAVMPGTVPSDAPHGWTVAPASSGETPAASTDSSAETSGATQVDTMQVQPDAAAKPTQEPFVNPSSASAGGQTEQGTGAHPEQASAAGASEPGHEKGSDGGS